VAAQGACRSAQGFRAVAAHGWRVVVADYSTWIEVKTQAQREEYLRGLLA
jgi:hypothetical protein